MQDRIIGLGGLCGTEGTADGRGARYQVEELLLGGEVDRERER